jgi:hypothetical protein
MSSSSSSRSSRYSVDPLDFSGLKTVSLYARGGKVRVEDFARVYDPSAPGMSSLLASLPHILAGDSFRAVVTALRQARQAGKAILWGLGGHVIKCGLSPILADLMDRGYATAFAGNGAAAIHDFEIALAGYTSEDVEAVLPDGSFGSAEETGREINSALAAGVADGLGWGESLGREIDRTAPGFCRHSLLWRAYSASVPFTIHVAIGTDTPHTHPTADGAVMGQATLRDFQLFCSLVRGLHQGGVYLNVGSAVVLPEVFLKAVSAVRNLGYPLREFTTVNFDFLQHYRPRVNVVDRPHAQSGGRGYALTGHHEILVPLLAAALIEAEDRP